MKTTLTLFLAPLIVIAQLVAAPGSAMAQTDDVARPQTTARATLHVDGMVGEACPVLITSALKRVDGIHHVEASYATHSASVEYDANRIGLDQIRDTIRSRAGFETEVAVER